MHMQLQGSQHAMVTCVRFAGNWNLRVILSALHGISCITSNTCYKRMWAGTGPTQFVCENTNCCQAIRRHTISCRHLKILQFISIIWLSTFVNIYRYPSLNGDRHLSAPSDRHLSLLSDICCYLAFQIGGSLGRHISLVGDIWRSPFVAKWRHLAASS